MLIQLLRDLTAECHADYVGLWSVIRASRRASGMTEHSKHVDRLDVERVLAFVQELLSQPGIVAGTFVDESRTFEKWEFSTVEAIERIRGEWFQLGRDPDIGEVVWFTSLPIETTPTPP